MNKQEEGFSLVELIIVIAIIAIISAIATPQFMAYRSQANDASAHADVKNSMQVISASLKQ